MIKPSWIAYVLSLTLLLCLLILATRVYAGTGSNNDSEENDRAVRQEAEQQSNESESDAENDASENTGSSESNQRARSRSTGEGSNESQVTYDSFTNFPGVGRISNLCQLTTAMWYLGFSILFLSVIGSILYGGFLYTSAGVNAAQVNQAKGVIQNSFVGLVLGLSVFIILQTIDPNLLSGNCNIESIEPFSYSAPTLSGTPTGDGPGLSTVLSGETSFPFACDYQRPSPGQRYGAPRPRRNGIHMGADLAPVGARADCPVLAFQDGEVVGMRCSGPIIRHENGLETRYYHNEKNFVRVGDRVTAGQEIGIAGNRDCGSAGIHLHFEILENGRYVNPENIIYDSNFQPNPDFLNSNVRAR